MAENTELMTVDNICNRVYVIRGQQVMLDYDLAEIYGYEVKRSIYVVDDYVNTKTLQLLSQNYLPGFRCLICAAAF